MITEIVTNLMVGLATAFVCIVGYEDRLSSLQRELRQEKRKYEELKSRADTYRDAYHELSRYQARQRIIMRDADIDDEVREAIKFAMSCSHPDKPTGDAEKFRKYHELYKKHCK